MFFLSISERIYLLSLAPELWPELERETVQVILVNGVDQELLQRNLLVLILEQRDVVLSSPPEGKHKNENSKWSEK